MFCLKNYLHANKNEHLTHPHPRVKLELASNSLSLSLPLPSNSLSVPSATPRIGFQWKCSCPKSDKRTCLYYYGLNNTFSFVWKLNRNKKKPRTDDVDTVKDEERERECWRRSTISQDTKVNAHPHTIRKTTMAAERQWYMQKLKRIQKAESKISPF